ncbi:MAG TPA: hypothetical protein VG184_00350 [Acidimicrobiales bacterium]|nr:hypothetical protein [Acidimicrobiales bacterium]
MLGHDDPSALGTLEVLVGDVLPRLETGGDGLTPGGEGLGPGVQLPQF